MKCNYRIIQKIRPLIYHEQSWNRDKAISTFPLVDINYKSNHGTLYASSGFLILQNAVSKVILGNLAGSKYKNLEITMNRLPEPPYKMYKYLTFSTYSYVTMLSLCYLITILELNHQLVSDRKNKYKEILKSHGVGKKIYYMSLIATNLVWFLIINGLLITGLCINFDAGAVIEFTNPAIIYIWTLAFSVNILSYTFFISSLFNKVSLLFFIQTRGTIEKLTMTKYLIWILPNTLFAVSIQIILRNEIIGSNFTWKNFMNTNLLDIESNIFSVVIIYIISAIIFFTCGLYIEEVRDKKPWYFLFKKDYWCSTKNMPAPETTPEDTPACSLYNFEIQDETDQREIVHIKNLKYKHETSAQLIEIKELKLYKGTICSIFGYKGSGKSNFLSLLCGEKKATAGKIRINGSIDPELPIRKIGIYKDKKILCKEMTVKENLHLYSLLKGIKNRNEVQRIAENWKLKKVLSFLCTNLSESVARKLSLAITFIGDPEAIFLNNPTKHTDEVTRNFILKAIEKQKETSLIIFTSTDPEECFAISDKVIILQNHEVKAIGSPMFLKTTYGVYSTCIFKSNDPFEMSQMKTYIKSQMNTTAPIHEDEFRIILKYEPSATFERLFEFSKGLKFMDSTLSEIPVHDLVDKILDRNTESNEELNDLGAEFTYVNKKKDSGLKFFFKQIKGIIYKKYILSKNNIVLTFSKLTMLAILVCLSHLSRTTPIDNYFILEDNVIFDLKAFGETKVIYSSTNNLGKTYASLLRNEDTQKLKISDRKDFVDFFTRKSKEDKITYKTKYIIAAFFENSKRITVYYNAAAFHSSAASLNYVYNCLISHELKEEQMKLNIWNVPLPSKDADSIYVGPHSNFYDSFYWAQELVLSTATVLTYYSTDFAEERKSKFKQLQYITGLNAFTYFLGSFAYDYLTYSISVFFSLEIITIFETPCLHREAEIAGLGILMYLHGITALLLIYCLSHIFKGVHIYNGIFLYYALSVFLVFGITELEVHSYQDTAYYANIIFSVLLTPYSMGRGIYELHRNCVAKSVCTSSVDDHSNLYRNEYYFCTGLFNGFHTGVQAIVLQLLLLIFQSFILILFLILLELDIHKIIWKRISCKNKKIDILDDTENRNVSSSLISLPSFSYPAEPEYVNDKYLLKIEIYEHNHRKKSTLSIKENECMTLIFHSSSEKEKFLNLIAGLDYTTQAKIIIKGNNIWEYPNKVMDHLGFNFTINCLQKEFTIGETLSIFSFLKGISKSERKKFIKELVQVLNLQPEFKVKDCNYSIKKKLTTAIAVMGLPPVVVLNQPSQNMDEISIKQTKKLIMMIKKAGSAVLLVSERFDGCEASCDKIAIIKEKQVVLNRPLNAANETGDLLIVVKLWLNKFRDIPAGGQVKVTKEDVLAYCQKEFPPYLVICELYYYIKLLMKKRNVIWTRLLIALENLKNEHFLNSYSVCKINFHDFIYHANPDTVSKYEMTNV